MPGDASGAGDDGVRVRVKNIPEKDNHGYGYLPPGKDEEYDLYSVVHVGQENFEAIVIDDHGSFWSFPLWRVTRIKND